MTYHWKINKKKVFDQQDRTRQNSPIAFIAAVYSPANILTEGRATELTEFVTRP